MGTAVRNPRGRRSDGGGWSAATLYSVVGTCRRLGHDPFVYLRDVFGRLPAVPAESLDAFLPGRGAAERGGATG
jgi:IS66 C-terminal element